MFEAYRTSSIDWKPSPVVALATSVDDSQVAAAREDGSLEIWLVSPGAVGWHCQLTIHGDPESRASSLIWCRAGSNGLPCGRLFSSSINGSVSQWDLFHLKQKTVLDSIGVSIWQMAVAPCSNDTESKSHPAGNGFIKANSIDLDDPETSDSEDDSDSEETNEQSVVEYPRVALACDDGCVRIYSITDTDEFVYTKSLPRVGGRVLSVAWSPDAKFIYSGSSDGIIRCWDAKLGHEIYRITVGLGGLGSGPELCVWSLLSLRCGNLVSADSTGSVQFWDSQHGTLLQVHSYHKGDVNALAAAPSHNRVFSAGSDGQVILYKLSSETAGSSDDKSSSNVMKKWIYVGLVKAHTHDIRALTVAVPISREDPLPDEGIKRARRDRHREKPAEFSYHKWAHLGVPMLISAGDDTKLIAYPVKEFTQFSPHDICPAPQRVSIQLALNTSFNQTSLLLVQASSWLDIMCVRTKSGAFSDMARGPSVGLASTDLLARVKCKASRKIICSTISNTGVLFAYSDHAKPSLFELKKCKVGKSALTVNRRPLPQKLPFAHSMVFSFDSSRLIIAGHDRRIYVVDVSRAELVHRFTPCRELHDQELPPSEPPITKMFTSSDGQWLAAINCFGDIYVFNLEIQRQHWFISRLDSASVTAGGFSPQNNNVLVITTSSNQVYALDVEERTLGDWSKQHTNVLPKRFQEFPGEVIGMSFPPSTSSSSVIVYSSRAMCWIDFGVPIDRDDESDRPNGLQSNSINGKRLKRKLTDSQAKSKLIARKNFEFYAFTNPALFVGHLSKSSILMIDKPWMEVFNTFDALELEVLDALSTLLPPIYCIGPLQLQVSQIPPDYNNLKSIESNLWREETECLEWLDSKEPNSVVYVNFGSITVMTSEQLIEFVWGLANSNKAFLWVIRPDLVLGESAVVPPEFLEETEERGLFSSWCPQEQVLSHPAVGGFLTHSGWNSSLESLCGGVPMICWPFFAEQQTNCRFCCKEWGVGIEIEGDVKRNYIEDLVRTLMEGEKGKEMRKKATEWKKLAEEAATGPNGLSFLALDNMINRVLLSPRNLN